MCEFVLKNFYEFMFLKSKEGWNVILYVVRNGNLEVLKFLRKENISFKYRLESDRNVLYIVCDYGYLDICKYVLKKCLFLFYVVDYKGWNVGYFVVRGGNVDIMKYFVLKKKVDMIKEINIGMNIFYMVCLYFYSEMCKYILFIYFFFVVMKI